MVAKQRIPLCLVTRDNKGNQKGIEGQGTLGNRTCTLEEV